MVGQRQLELGDRGLGAAASTQAEEPASPPAPSISSSLAALAGCTLSLGEGPLTGCVGPWLEGAGSSTAGAEQPVLRTREGC